MKKIKRTKKGEIDIIKSSAETMTPYELKKFLQNRFSEDLHVFRRLVSEAKKGINGLGINLQLNLFRKK